MKWSVDRNKYLAPAEISALLTKVSELSQRDREQFRDTWIKIETLLMIAFNLGTRCQEMKTMRHGDLFLDDETPFVQVTGKRGFKRCIPINAALKIKLDKFIHWKQAMGQATGANDFLFTSPRGNCYSTGAVEQWFIRALSVTGLRRRSLHASRHSFAFCYYSKFHDVRGLQQLLGHSNLGTTMVYTSTAWDQLSKNCESLY